ncbi:MAG: dimethylsulfonioproprionate lyase family protein [Acidimicrobiia bacterium]|nr:dimethylsulfonioproprionate lyase family protein [Acidimicrobiia bacterium]
MSLPGLDVLVSLIEAEVGRALSATDLDAGSGEDRSVLESLPSALRGLVPSERPVPTSHPALGRWLDPAVESAPEQQRPLAAAVRALAPHLTWKSAYPDAPSSPTMRRFWANYAFAPVATPEGGVGGVGPLLSAEMSLYLVVQGAGIEYGRHHHPATEVYGIVSGTARWLRGDHGFRSRAPGDVFVHQPDVVHATTTGVEPAISWAAWLGDLESRPLLETSNGSFVKV